MLGEKLALGSRQLCLLACVDALWLARASFVALCTADCAVLCCAVLSCPVLCGAFGIIDTRQHARTY